MTTCACNRCVNKIPTPGFFKAPRSAYETQAGIQAELDYWLESRVGYDPKVGRPDLDNTIERPRTSAMLKAVLAQTRAKYPRAFRAGALAKEQRADRQPIPHEPSNPETLAEMRAKMAGKVTEGETA